MSQETHGVAIAELWAFAYYHGFDEPGTMPPAIDPKRLAEHCRAVLDEMNEQSNRHARCNRIEGDNGRLLQQVEAYHKELVRLRAQLAEEIDKNVQREHFGETGI